MRRIAALSLLLLLTSLPVSADVFRFDPPDPDSSDALSMRVAGLWSLGCKPGNPRVTVANFVINVRLDVIGQCAHMLPAFQRYSVEVPIGVLTHGTYEVVVEAFEGATRIELGRTILVVREAPPVIGGSRTEVLPSVIFPGQPRILIRAEGIACPPNASPCPNTTSVRINGVAVGVEAISANEIIVTPPFLNAGATVDVEIVAQAGWTATIHNAIRVADPGGEVDPSLFERVLIPVIHNGPGAFGSQWRTDVWLRNESDSIIPIMHTPAQAIGCVPPNCNVPLNPRESKQLGVQSAPSGYFLHVARGSVDDLSVNAVFRDITQQERSLGEEMPVVRESEFITGKQSLLNIPSDFRFRTRLRVYGFRPEPGLTLTLPFAIYHLTGNDPLAQGAILLAPPADGIGPAFGELHDIDALFPQISGLGPFRIELGPLETADNRYWALASVTNNETQHVTLITPR
jgi:hypothetical protein